MLGMTWLLWLVVGAPLRASMAIKDTKIVEPKVHLRQGVIRGKLNEDAYGNRFYSFKKIPYAKPPVGPLRFRDPEPAGRWEGIRDGTQPTPRCSQFDLPNYFKEILIFLGQEDCLFLNVFVPESTRACTDYHRTWSYSYPETTVVQPMSTDLPVMVFFHGGVYSVGWAELYEPGPLMRRDVIVVVLQYRLGALGFMTTGDDVIPGNLGLKDQVMALRWVQENIRDFGGDPSRVTLVGESIGAALVHFHILSPMSAGLFQRVIMMSGQGLAPWAMWFNQGRWAVKVGKLLNCSCAFAKKVDTTALAACLRSKSIEDLVFVQRYIAEWGTAPTVMKPTIDGEFLPDHPATLMREGRYNKVDLIAGLTKDQGIVLTIFMKDEDMMIPLVENFTHLGPIAFVYQSNEEDPLYLSHRTWHHYMGPLTSEMSADRFQNFTNLFCDMMFNVGHLEVSETHAKDAYLGHKLFMYEFDHHGQFHTMDRYFGKVYQSRDGNTSRDGYSGHLDDLMYFFNLPNVTLKSPRDRYVSQIMVDLWSNFAETGDPTPYTRPSLGFKWNQVYPHKLSQLTITTAPKMTTPTYIDKVNTFWRTLPTIQNKLFYPDRFKKDKNV